MERRHRRERRRSGTGPHARRAAGMGMMLSVVLFLLPLLTVGEGMGSAGEEEMPAAFEEEALKAQACAARTYTVGKQERTTQAHPEADVCTDINCCQAYVPGRRRRPAGA